MFEQYTCNTKETNLDILGRFKFTDKVPYYEYEHQSTNYVGSIGILINNNKVCI